MELQQTPLWDEANKILEAGPTSTNYSWQVQIHTPEDTLTPVNVHAVNIVRAYSENYSDVITVSVLMGAGAFSRRVFPHRDKLEITLKRVPLLENQDSADVNAKIEAERYSAVLIGKYVSPTVGRGTETNDEFALDLSALLDVHFQLIDKAFEQIKTLQTGGVARGTDVQSILTTMISTQTANIKVGADRALKGVDMIACDNKEVKEQIVIPHAVQLVDLPDFVQSLVGVYSSGIGTYIQNGYWYIYPLYDTADFTRRLKTLTLLVMPQKKLSGIERTFKVEGNTATILVTGETGFRDDGGTNYRNYGNGMRFTNASKVLEENRDTSGNKTRLSRKENNSEFITQKSVVQYAQLASQRITANPFPQLSLQASKRGGLFKAVWENSDYSLVIPGMLVKVIYHDQDRIREMYGVVQKATHVSMKPGGLTTQTFRNQSVLEIFVNDQLRQIEE